MEESKRIKKTISAGVSPYVLENIDKALQRKEYAGQSDLISIALIEHFEKEEIKKRDEKLIEVYQALLQSEEGKRILSTIKISEHEEIEALKKRGIACVELGDLDEAIKWFTKAKELESIQPSEQKKKIDQKGKDEYIGEVIFD